ncbi:glutathione synthase [Hydrogenophilus hirschii]
MELLFLIDPLAALNPKKDSSLFLMREAAARGHTIWVAYPGAIAWRHDRVCAEALPLAVDPNAPHTAWAEGVTPRWRALREFSAVLLRFDPPFDFEYLTLTWLLERAEQEGARIFNAPRAVRDHSEKLSILEFAEFIPPTQVVRRMLDVQEAIDALGGDVIVKPLDAMGGAGIFRVRHDDPNRNAIVETLTAQGQRTIMVQQYLPAIADGDKRVLLIAGSVVPWALARIPKAGETRGNLAAGGTGVAMPLTPEERRVAETLAPILWRRGLFFVGLDLIGGRLTEINVTSPTCFVEIAAQSGENPAACAIERLEAVIANH